MQSVFNRGECMMHIDKNADGHVPDVDQISREITYVPLNGRIRSKRSSCMQPFSFWKKKMSTRHAYQWSNGFEVLDVLPRSPMDLKFGHASQRFNGFEIWTCFPEA